MIYLFCLLLSLDPASAKTKSKYKEPPIPKNTMIVVTALDRKRRLLEIEMESAPAVGPNMARPEILADAVGFSEPSEKKTFIDDPSRFVGSRYELKKDLELVTAP